MMSPIHDRVADDSSAVSPVIGVVLMVAVTVMLAAVIGSFVFGFGQGLDGIAPNVNFEFEYDASSTPDLRIVHVGGDSVPTVELAFVGAEPCDWGGEDHVRVGSTCRTNVTDDTVRIVWGTGDRRAVLATFPVPAS